MISREALAPSSSDAIGFDDLRSRVEQFRKEFDRILIDAPPLNLHGDGVALAQVADGLVLIVEAEATRRQAAQNVIRNLREAGVKVLGAVLNNRTFPIPEGLYRRL
jgi:Mrp family chromosome partitioning ATPase